MRSLILRRHADPDLLTARDMERERWHQPRPTPVLLPDTTPRCPECDRPMVFAYCDGVVRTWEVCPCAEAQERAA